MTENEQEFTERELLQYNGEDNPMYIAYQGIVYDVTDCPKWHTGLHERLHWPGQDLTKELSDAPHTSEVFKSPCIRRVGILIST